MVKNEKGQGWKKRGDGWLGHPFLKAWSSQASQAVKFTLLILCNNLRQRGRKRQRCEWGRHRERSECVFV